MGDDFDDYGYLAAIVCDLADMQLGVIEGGLCTLCGEDMHLAQHKDSCVYRRALKWRKLHASVA